MRRAVVINSPAIFRQIATSCADSRHLPLLEQFQDELSSLAVSSQSSEYRNHCQTFIDILNEIEDGCYQDVPNDANDDVDASLGAFNEQISELEFSMLLSGRDAIDHGSLFNDRNVKSMDRDFAKGNCATVSKVTYKNGVTAIFKTANRPVDSMAAQKFGIPARGLDAGLADRAILFYQLDKLLGIGATPETRYALHGQIGCSQDFVAGKPILESQYKPVPGATKYFRDENMLRDIYRGDDMYQGYRLNIDPAVADYGSTVPIVSLVELLDQGLLVVEKEGFAKPLPIDFSEPGLQKRMANIHLLEYLCGTIDRNPTNILYERKVDDAGRETWVPHLIDNELSFALNLSAEELNRLPELNQFATARLPLLIDQEMANRLATIKGRELVELTNTYGLNENAIQAMTARWKKLVYEVSRAKLGISS